MIKLKFYFNPNNYIECITICKVKGDEPIAFFEKVKESLQDQINLEELANDEWYSAKLKRKHKKDDLGISQFDGYNVFELTKCTNIW